MSNPAISLLSRSDIEAIHDTSLKILRDVGLRIHHVGVLERLAQAGAFVDRHPRIARFSEGQVMEALEVAGKRFIVRGRDPEHVARYGYGDVNLISSPGQYGWFDHHGGPRREPLIQDAIHAARVGDALSLISTAHRSRPKSSTRSISYWSLVLK